MFSFEKRLNKCELLKPIESSVCLMNFLPLGYERRHI